MKLKMLRRPLAPSPPQMNQDSLKNSVLATTCSHAEKRGPVSSSTLTDALSVLMKPSAVHRTSAQTGSETLLQALSKASPHRSIIEAKDSIPVIQCIVDAPLITCDDVHLLRGSSLSGRIAQFKKRTFGSSRNVVIPDVSVVIPESIELLPVAPSKELDLPVTTAASIPLPKYSTKYKRKDAFAVITRPKARDTGSRSEEFVGTTAAALSRVRSIIWKAIHGFLTALGCTYYMYLLFYTVTYYQS